LATLTSGAELSLVSPLSGLVVPIERVPDPVFAGRVVGDGIAIEPLSAELLAPCDARVSVLHKAGHAVTLTAANGAEILLHIGVDTVRLAGRGFSPRVAQGARVRAGDVLVAFDADEVARHATSLQTIVVVANAGYGIPWRAPAGDTLLGGRTPLMRVSQGAGAGAGADADEGADADAGVWSAMAVVGHADGLHARPAALVQAAARDFAAEVVVELDGRNASARSIVALMSLGARFRDRVTVRATGAEAQAALARVVAKLETASHSDQTAARATPSPAATVTTATTVGDGRGLHGVCAAPGLARGRVVRLDAAEAEPPTTTGDVATERSLLASAVGRVREDLSRTLRDPRVQAVPQQRAILAMHAALLDDPELAAAAEDGLARGLGAGHAFRAAVRAHCDVLSATGNPLLAERAADLRELERRVVAAMTGTAAALPELFDRSILVAEDVGVAELSRLPRERVAGICTARGGATSHVAILARALGVPALVAVGPALLRVPHGREVILDATAGSFDDAPDPARLAEAGEAMERRSRERTAALAEATAPARTRDGRAVEVAANVATEEDVRVAVAHGADGVGLMRTELLFVDRVDEPTEAEQARAYQATVDALGGRPAIIRTLDAGGDKPLPFLPMPPEENPALGLRGIRSALARPEVLARQLRALLSVKPLALCRVMLPMITDVGDLLAVRAQIEKLARAACLAERPQVGVMIEVPSAALLAAQLAAHADFLSIGTNDLTQYTLAMDRGNAELAARVDGLHPAVLRLVAQTVQGAQAHGKWVGVCGALASDLEAVPILIGLGVTELSVGPPLVPDVKALVRRLDYATCRREAHAALDLPSATAVRERARALPTALATTANGHP
jgi:phosphoenolpyruvate-protein phosphotransferase